MKVNWSKAKNAYVTGNKSYRDIAKQYKIAPSVVSKPRWSSPWDVPAAVTARFR